MLKLVLLDNYFTDIVLLDNFFSDIWTEFQIWYWKTFNFGLVDIFFKKKIKQTAAKIWLFLTVQLLIAAYKGGRDCWVRV